MRRYAILVATLVGGCQFDPAFLTGLDAASDGSVDQPDTAALADATADPADAEAGSPDGLPSPDAKVDAMSAASGLGTIGTATVVGDLGGSGGSPFTEDCPEGRVVTGIFGKDNSFGLTRVGVACSWVTLSDSGAVGMTGTVQSATHGTEMSVIDIAPVDCPAGTVVAGFSGTSSSDDLVHSVRIRCGAITWDGSSYSIGALDEQPPLGSASSFASDAANCPAGQVAGGFAGRDGTILDNFKLRCFALTPVP